MPSLCRLAAALLGATLLAAELYLSVLGLFCTPKGQFYRDFYLTHTRLCWLSPDVAAQTAQALARPEIAPGTLNKAETCYVVARGWSATLPWGVISRKPAAWLDLPPPPGATALIVTLAATSQRYGERVRISLDGRTMTRVTLPPGNAPVDVRIPIPAQQQGYLQLRFDMRHWLHANALGVLRVRWVE
jgi:hypothetical protein